MKICTFSVLVTTYQIVLNAIINKMQSYIIFILPESDIRTKSINNPHIKYSKIILLTNKCVLSVIETFCFISTLAVEYDSV